MFETYTKQSLAEAKVSLNIMDKKIYDDFIDYKPDGIPSDKEWQMDGIFDSFFNSQKKEAGRKRIHFNAGVMLEVCLHHFDGSDKDLEKFCIRAIKEGLYQGSMIAKDFKKTLNNPSLEFRIGRDWSKGFIDRNISKTGNNINTQTSSYDKNEYDDDPIDFEDNYENDSKSRDEDITIENNEGFSLLKNIKNDVDTRFEFYKELFEFEISGHEELFKKENLDILNKINISSLPRREIKAKLDNYNKDLSQYLFDYNSPKFETIFLLPEIIFNIFKSQGFKVEIEVLFPDSENEVLNKNDPYPNLKSIPFFKFRDIVLKNNKISFNQLNMNFPRYGRFFICPNLNFYISIKLLVKDYSHIIYYRSHELNYDSIGDFFKFNDELYKDPKVKKYDIMKIQDIRSINHQVKNKYSIRGGFNRVSLYEYLSADNEYYHEKYLNFKKVYDELNNDLKYDHASNLNELSKLNLCISGSISADYIIEECLIYCNNEYYREEYYNKNGSYYDDFDLYTLENLNKNDFNLDIKSLKKGHGILPMTVQIALIMERKIAPYIYDIEHLSKFKDLYDDISDDNILRIEYSYNNFKREQNKK